MEKLHIQPSELDMLYYYELEYMVSIYNEILDDRRKNEEENSDKELDKYNMASIKNSITGFKPPAMPAIKMPKL